MNRVAIVVFCGFAAVSVHAQTVPLVERSVTVLLGAESIGGPVFVVDAAPRALAMGLLPFVQARVDVHAASVAVVGGGQLEQQVSDWFFVREAAGAGLFFAAVDGLAVGGRGNLTLQAGLRFWGCNLVSGPAVGAAVAVADDGAVDQRLTPGWNTALTVPVVDLEPLHLTAVGHLDAGYDFGGHGSGGFRGGAFAGLRLSF